MKDYRGNLIETPFDILFILSRSLTVNVISSGFLYPVISVKWVVGQTKLDSCQFLIARQIFTF